MGRFDPSCQPYLLPDKGFEFGNHVLHKFLYGPVLDPVKTEDQFHVTPEIHNPITH